MSQEAKSKSKRFHWRQWIDVLRRAAVSSSAVPSGIGLCSFRLAFRLLLACVFSINNGNASTSDPLIHSSQWVGVQPDLRYMQLEPFPGRSTGNVHRAEYYIHLATSQLAKNGINTCSNQNSGYMNLMCRKNNSTLFLLMICFSFPSLQTNLVR